MTSGEAHPSERSARSSLRSAASKHPHWHRGSIFFSTHGHQWAQKSILSLITLCQAGFFENSLYSVTIFLFLEAVRISCPFFPTEPCLPSSLVWRRSLYRNGINSLRRLMNLIHTDLLLRTVFFDTNATFSRQSDLWVISFMMSIAHSPPRAGEHGTTLCIPLPPWTYSLHFSLYPSGNYTGGCKSFLGLL